MSEEKNAYELSRNFWNWAFKNPELISPNHAAVYFFAIEHCNRLGWKDKFGFPTQMVMEAIGIKKHQTYIRYFDELCEWGFFKLVQKSTNQYSANIISLISAKPKNGKALDKAFITHAAKQTESNGQSNSTVDKPITIKPINQLTIDERKKVFATSLEVFVVEYGKEMVRSFFDYWREPNKSNTKMRFEMQQTWDISLRLANWKRIEEKKSFKPKTYTASALPKDINYHENLPK